MNSECVSGGKRRSSGVRFFCSSGRGARVVYFGTRTAVGFFFWVRYRNKSDLPVPAAPSTRKIVFMGDVHRCRLSTPGRYEANETAKGARIFMVDDPRGVRGKDW